MMVTAKRRERESARAGAAKLQLQPSESACPVWAAIPTSHCKHGAISDKMQLIYWLRPQSAHLMLDPVRQSLKVLLVQCVTTLHFPTQIDGSIINFINNAQEKINPNTTSCEGILCSNFYLNYRHWVCYSGQIALLVLSVTICICKYQEGVVMMLKVFLYWFCSYCSQFCLALIFFSLARSATIAVQHIPGTMYFLLKLVESNHPSRADASYENYYR